MNATTLKIYKNKMDRETKTAMKMVIVNTRSLVEIAIYLSGVKDGKGNLQPLGTVVLEDLWNAIKYLQGDVGYSAEKDEREENIEKVYRDRELPINTKNSN